VQQSARARLFLPQAKTIEKQRTQARTERERETERAREVQRVCIRPGIIRLLYLYGFFYRTETAISYETKSQSLASVANWSHPTAGKPITRFTLLYLEASDDVHVRSGCAHKDTGSTTESAF
jgi:hypothetical protein